MRSLEEWPDSTYSLHGIARLYYEQGEYARALEYYMRAKETSPTSPFPYVNMAQAELQLKLYPEAFADLKDAVELGFGENKRLALSCADLLLTLAVKFAAVDRPELAVEACQHVLRIRHADPRTRKKAQEYVDWIYGGGK